MSVYSCISQESIVKNIDNHQNQNWSFVDKFHYISSVLSGPYRPNVLNAGVTCNNVIKLPQ